MARIEVSREMAVPHELVWEALADLGSHAGWMKDAESLEFTSEQTTGLGAVMEVETRIGPFRTLDILEITGWDEGRSIDVAHRGLVTGEGRLEATAIGRKTLVSWVENLQFPWWLGGPVTAWLARPVLRTIWRGNLRRLEDSLSAR